MRFLDIRNSLFWRLSVTFLLIFVLLGFAYVLITTFAARRYYEETTQKLNADVAKHLIKEVSPFVNGEVNKDALNTLMHSMMAVNPGIEIYLIDPEGGILDHVVLDKKVKLNSVSTAPIKTFVDAEEPVYILGDDPRNPGEKTVFSATRVEENGELQGYVYIVLASEKFETISNTLMGSYWLRISTKSFAITLISAFIIGLLLIAYLTKNLRVIINTVNEFEEGNHLARVPEKNTKGELAVLSRNFNKMADTILSNIDELKKVDQLRKELIANVSHDLRSPLAVIHGYIETLLIKEDTLDHEERRKYLKIILDSSERLKRMVADLFELSKLEAGQITAKKEPFLINELVQDASQKIHFLAQQKDINVNANIEQSLPMVYADISMIDRVIQNLLDNAIKYTPDKGWIRLEVKQQNGQVYIKVANSGAGIPEEDLPSIFDRYFKVQKESTKSEGTGLGLAIVKKILDLHDSTIRVESIPDKATKFEFDLSVYQSVN